MNGYYAITYRGDYLEHHGIVGQKWGIRRYQNPDGSYTAAGRARYSTYGEKRLAKAEESLSKARSKSASLAKSPDVRARTKAEKKSLAELSKYLDTMDFARAEQSRAVLSARSRSARYQSKLDKYNAKNASGKYGKKIEKLSSKKKSYDLGGKNALAKQESYKKKIKKIVADARKAGYDVSEKSTYWLTDSPQQRLLKRYLYGNLVYAAKSYADGTMQKGTSYKVRRRG